MVEKEGCQHEQLTCRHAYVDEIGLVDSQSGHFDGYDVCCAECNVVLRHYVPHEITDLIWRDYNKETEK